MTTRKKYTREFKEDAVRLVTEQGYSPSEAARNSGMDRGMLARWIEEFQADESEAFRGNGKRTKEQEELRRLHEENRRLKRDFTVTAPDRVYAGDIASVWTQKGWLYPAVVIDLYVRKAVGWSMGRRPTSVLVRDALQMALWQRRPPKGQLTHHSDRGVQYASQAFRKW